jgi:hypothetical protein
VTDEALRHLLPMFFVWSYKVVALAVGYLFARLGHSLFLKGVTGEFKFHVEAKGAKADLISASPGLFLILMGAIIVSVGLYKGLAFEVTQTSAPMVNEVTEPESPQRPAKPEFTRIPSPTEKNR